MALRKAFAIIMPSPSPRLLTVRKALILTPWYPMSLIMDLNMINKLPIRLSDARDLSCYIIMAFPVIDSIGKSEKPTLAMTIAH